jgi:3-methyladenine DNA glycosylase/8-oxoguanine DNA glycosylase
MWSHTLTLRGAGGEPVDFRRTLLSHGVADLLPNRIAPDGSRLDTVLSTSTGPVAVALTSQRADTATLAAAGPKDEVVDQVRFMLRLDEDLSGFYAVARADPNLAWTATGAGRMLRSPTVFEDVVKTICTTNCTWAATVRMVSALVDELGDAADDGHHAFPTPRAMAAAGEDFYRDHARAGYRGAYLRSLAGAVAEGRLDLEVLDDPALPDDEVAQRLLALDGVGPYAMAHVMMLLGRYRRLILDSWTRPTYRRLTGRPRVTDKGIERAFRRYRQFAGLAFWLTLTEHWVTEAAP